MLRWDITKWESSDKMARFDFFDNNNASSINLCNTIIGAKYTDNGINLSTI